MLGTRHWKYVKTISISTSESLRSFDAWRFVEHAYNLHKMASGVRPSGSTDCVVRAKIKMFIQKSPWWIIDNVINYYFLRRMFCKAKDLGSMAKDSSHKAKDLKISR